VFIRGRPFFEHPGVQKDEVPFFFRKLIEALMLPLGLSCLLVLAGVLWRRRLPAVLGVLLLLLCSTPFVGRLLMAPLESAWPVESIGEAPSADAIVVLSGGIVRGVSRPGVQWSENSNRFFAGLDLAMAGKAKLLVLSAGAPPVKSLPSQGALMREVAASRGFPEDRIIVTRYVLTTEDEARAVSALPGIHSILLVTSAFHMPRAALLFRAAGVDVHPFPSDQRVLGVGDPSGPFAFLPEPSRLQDAQSALREYYGLAIYRTLLLVRPGSLARAK
jgi:uncharacterized SAM-binding protein YcdF (DUF218 family)